MSESKALRRSIQDSFAKVWAHKTGVISVFGFGMLSEMFDQAIPRVPGDET